MTEIIDEVKTLKLNKFRPKNWKKNIAELTGFGESYVEKFFAGSRYNLKVSFEIISLFNSEKQKLLSELEMAKVAR